MNTNLKEHNRYCFGKEAISQGYKLELHSFVVIEWEYYLNCGEKKTATKIMCSKCTYTKEI